MARRKSAAEWRAFLRALARTGNARVAAREAGMDAGTAYDKRIKDEGFAARWDEAMAKARGKGPLRRPSRNAMAGPELVLRRTKHGDKMVRAAEGRWCREVEEAFFGELERTACVRAAAAASGISVNALYKRREHYPEFAGKWAAVEARAAQHLPELLRAAAIASLDPDPSPAPAGAGRAGRGRRRLPKIDVDQAIAISRLKGPGAGDGRGPRPNHRERMKRQEESEEELTAALLEQLDALHRRSRRDKLAAGWSEAEDGILIPPGWVRAGPCPSCGAPGEGGRDG